MSFAQEMTNDPSTPVAKPSAEAANPTATNEKGNNMSTSDCTRNPSAAPWLEGHEHTVSVGANDNRCAPWCDQRLRGVDPAEHSEHCHSRYVGRVNAVDNHGIKLRVSLDIVNERALANAINRVRMYMDPVYGDAEPRAIAMAPAEARSAAEALLLAADVAEGLTSLPGAWYTQNLYGTAAALADQADRAFEDGNDTVSDALDSAAAHLRALAGKAE